MSSIIFFDTEIFSNYHLLLFKKESKYIEAKCADDVYSILKDNIIITFNGNVFDIPLLRYYLAGATTEEIKSAANDIIGDRLSYNQFFSKYNCDQNTIINTIDLIEVCPGHGSLKLYGARFHSKNLQELPYDHHATLTEPEKKIIKEYCKNDLDVTELLFNKLEKQINQRRTMSNQYKIDLRSKSDSQIAEMVIKNKIGYVQRTPRKSEEFFYEVPEFVDFKGPKMKLLLDELKHSTFSVDEKGSIKPPNVLKETVKINNTTYQLGMGGLHSQEQNCSHVLDDKNLICDFDVASYYPSIILNLGLYPKRIGKKFLEVYQELVTERLTAKHNGDKAKADSLKITINGSFGKFGSIYSNLYAPDLLIQVTVTGQLALLMLIERMEAAGIEVVSANTDGIVCKCPYEKEKEMLNIIEKWEVITNFNMERTDYLGLYSRDVNNYCAVKLSGEVKTKGCYSNAGWQKNPANEICNDAIINFLVNKVPFENTIKSCKQIEKFLTVRTVNGGAVKRGEFLGKVIRWYYRKNDFEPISYKTNGNQVASSLGAQPLMTLPDEFPTDINYEWYLFETRKMYDAFFGKAIKEPVVRKTSAKSPVVKAPKKQAQLSLF